MILRVLQTVYTHPWYTLLTLCVSSIVFVSTVWFPNVRLIMSVLASGDISFVHKVQLPLSLLGSITTNFTLFSAVSMVVITLLFGVYVSLTVFFLRSRIATVKNSGTATGVLGIASGVLGVGCAACGSFLLTTLSFVGASGVVTFLPLGGGELGIIGVFLLAYAIYKTAKQIENPLVCTLKR